MKILILLGLLIFLFAGCNRNNDISEYYNGSLPMVISNSTSTIDGDALLLFDYGQIIDRNFKIGDIIAIIGDDQPILRKVAIQMLEGIGLSYPGVFGQNEMLTLQQAHDIMRLLYPTAMQIYLNDENRDKYISYALWVELYIQLLKQQENVHNVKAINIIPLGAADGQILTNRGSFGGKDINLGAFLDQEIRILHRNREILAVLGITDLTPILKNAMVTHSDNFGIRVFIGGATRNYVYMPGFLPPNMTSDNAALIANVQIYGQEIIAITPAEAVITGTIERVRTHAIELQEWGIIPLCPSFAVYGLPATAKTGQDLLVGASVADFHLINGKIGAAVITRYATPINIRVVIGTSRFMGLVHESITISGTGPFTVHSGNRIERFDTGQHFTVNQIENPDLWGNVRLYISPENPVDHRLIIVGLGRNWAQESPQYRGTLEIARYNGHSGGFVIVNELCIEEYLYAVIPSEMPMVHGLEAAKVQAITARSFAIHRFYQNAFREFGAHVDDSVISQVYNNIPETEISIAAVNATRGQVLTVNGELVIANYFSTSGGTTANYGEVWAQGVKFPGYTPIHLVSVPQFYTSDHPLGDLSKEHYADTFFRSRNIPALDRNFPWFRWQVRLTAEELSHGINANIAGRQTANPALIQAINANGEPTGTAVETIGQLVNLEITRRGQGGNIMEIIFTGTKAAVRVQTEFNIRTLLNPGSTPVIRHDGSQATNLQLLPSAFFTMEKETDTNGHISAVTFFGGGNGHGVGMSQNGVRALIDKGLNYRDILRHYYPGAEVSLLGR